MMQKEVMIPEWVLDLPNPLKYIKWYYLLRPDFDTGLQTYEFIEKTYFKHYQCHKYGTFQSFQTAVIYYRQKK